MDDHGLFLKHLRESSTAVNKIAYFFKQKGFQVKVPSIKETPSYEERMSYTDDGDLWIKAKIEVKQLSKEFTERETFPYKDIIVCAKHAWDNAVIKPHSYWLLSKKGDYAAVVHGTSFNKWYTDKIVDRRYESHAQYVYFCPTEYVDFTPIKEGTLNAS